MNLAVILAATARAGPGDVVINEIHYAPADKTLPEEFVELYNAGGIPVDLTGWSITGAVRFAFPSGLWIAPGEFLVVAQNPVTLQSIYGVSALGPFSGRLSNDGETVYLRGAFGLSEDLVDYGRGFPWPTVGGGMGSSIELVHPSLDNELGGSWRASGVSLDESSPRVDFIARRDPRWHYRKGTSEASNPVSARREDDLFRGDAFTPPCDGNTVAEGGNVTLADFNGDAAVDSADAVAILQYLFQNGPAHASGELCVRIESCPRTCGL